MERRTITWRVAALMSSAAGALLSWACADPTEIRILIATDLPCAVPSARGVTIARGGALGGDALTSTTQCTDGTPLSTIGSLVFVPSGDKSEEVTFSVMMGVTRPSSTCAANAYEGCVIARRRLRYSPRTRIELPIDLTQACIGVACGDDTTCDRGACVPATENPRATTAPTANVDAGPDATRADGGTESGTDGNITDGSGTDGNITDGSGTDGNITDGSGTDGNVTDGSVTPILVVPTGVQAFGVAATPSELYWTTLYGVFSAPLPLATNPGSTFSLDTPATPVAPRGIAVSTVSTTTRVTVASLEPAGWCLAYKISSGGSGTFVCSNGAAFSVALNGNTTSAGFLDGGLALNIGDAAVATGPVVTTGYIEGNEALVYVPINGGVLSVDPLAPGTFADAGAVPGTSVVGLAVGDVNLYVTTTDDRVVAINRSTGALRTLFPMPLLQDLAFVRKGKGGDLYIAGGKGISLVANIE